MTLVAKTGLHCGWVGSRVVSDLVDRVTPVAKTGLHCGPTWHAITEVQCGT